MEYRVYIEFFDGTQTYVPFPDGALPTYDFMEEFRKENELRFGKKIQRIATEVLKDGDTRKPCESAGQKDT